MSRAARISTLRQELLDGLHDQTMTATLITTLLLGLLLSLIGGFHSAPAGVGQLGFALTVLSMILWWVKSKNRSLAGAIGVLAYAALAIGGTLALRSFLPLLLLTVPCTLASLLGRPEYGLGIALTASIGITITALPLDPATWYLAPLLLTSLWLTQAAVTAAKLFIKDSVERSWSDYDRMRSLLEEARDQRLELKEAQDNLLQANAELERLSKRLATMSQIAEEARQAKERFLANVSHELRTPLNMVIGFSEVITQAPDIYGSDLPGGLLADITVIQRNSQHLANLVDDILDLSKAEAGRMALNKDWVSIQEIIESAVLAVQPLFRSKRLTLDVNMASEIPLLYCDRVRIRQVVLNILVNAGRFTQEGGATVSVRAEGDRIICHVTDTGQGISREDQEQIFEPFHQAVRSETGESKGTGLGLHISKHFINLHGGEIWVESEVGQGTTFGFSLPMQPSSPAALSDLRRWFSPHDRYESRKHPSGPPRVESRPRFVLLEQNGMLAHIMTRYELDAELVSTRSAAEALKELQKSPAEGLIVNDPLVEEVAKRVPELIDLPHNTPAVVCWAPGNQQMAARLGVARYFVKPVSRQRLLEGLEALNQSVETILIVDDETEAVQLMERIISSSGRSYKILKATKAARALTLLREHRPDLVLLDLIMPGMDGFQLLAEKKSDPRISDIPVFVISGREPTLEFSQSKSLLLIHHGVLELGNILSYIGTLNATTRTDPRA